MHEQEGFIPSAMMEQDLMEALRTERHERWLTENREEMDAYNAYVEAHGVFSDVVRSF